MTASASIVRNAAAEFFIHGLRGTALGPPPFRPPLVTDCWRPFLSVADAKKLPQRIFNATENAKICGKNMPYAHFAKICQKCGKVLNTLQLYTRVFLTCLIRVKSIQKFS